MGGWPPKQVGEGRLAPKQVGDGRLAPKTGRRWEVSPQNRWERGGWHQKQVEDGRLAPKTGGRWEVETPATSPLLCNTVCRPLCYTDSTRE